jgi:Protein of unknown function (DUF3224)
MRVLYAATCDTLRIMRAEGTFNLDRFDDEAPYDDREGVQLSRAHISKTFRGDLAGTSETDIITVVTQNPAAYTGIERDLEDRGDERDWRAVRHPRRGPDHHRAGRGSLVHA